MQNKNVAFHLIADARCNGAFDHVQFVEYIDASLFNRYVIYNRDMSVYSAVLCFGNIPVPQKLNIPVYTYFHNINLLTLLETRSLKEKIVSSLKREVFRYYKKNTGYWLVQTSNTRNELINHLREKPERVMLMPFYDLPDKLSSLVREKHGEDYVYIAAYVPGKGHDELLNAWTILHKKGFRKTLHLTVPFNKHPFVDKIEEAQRLGVNIVNHGHIPFEKVIDLFHKSKAIIYPSHNESLGLGIVEALTAGCDVIGSDLPYIHSICKPSCVFNPYSPESIAEAVMAYEKGDLRKSELLIHNQIDDLIDLLVK